MVPCCWQSAAIHALTFLPTVEHNFPAEVKLNCKELAAAQAHRYSSIDASASCFSFQGIFCAFQKLERLLLKGLIWHRRGNNVRVSPSKQAIRRGNQEKFSLLFVQKSYSHLDQKDVVVQPRCWWAMSSQLGRRQEAICFQLLSEENKAAEVKQSEPEGRGNNRGPLHGELFPRMCRSTPPNHGDWSRGVILASLNLISILTFMGKISSALFLILMQLLWLLFSIKWDLNPPRFSWGGMSSATGHEDSGGSVCWMVFLFGVSPNKLWQTSALGRCRRALAALQSRGKWHFNHFNIYIPASQIKNWGSVHLDVYA